MKEKFYDLLQEMVQYEVKDLLHDPELNVNVAHNRLQTHIDRVEGRLGLLDRRLAILNRQLSNTTSLK